MHWDYRGKIFISTNLYWQDQGRANNSMNNAMTGAFILWYEHYGSVEIGLKALYAYFYMMSYPDIEDLTTLEGNSPFSHLYHMYNISQHWGRIGLSKEYEDIFTEIPNIFWERGQWR
jgi:hypothetical protein